MFKLTHALYTILNLMKDFSVGYTTSSMGKMMIDYEDKRYMIEITEIEEPDTEMHKDIKKYF